jgi:hypothetical protein
MSEAQPPESLSGNLPSTFFIQATKILARILMAGVYSARWSTYRTTWSRIASLAQIRL